jgi:beta-galactosidase
MGLWQVTGCRESAVETAPNGRTMLRWTGTLIPGVNAGDRIPARWYKETLEPLSPDAHVVAEYEDGTPAAIVATYGRGRVLTLGSYVSAAYESTPTPEGERLFRALLGWAGVTLPIEVTGSSIEARHLEAGSDTLLFLFNHAPDAAHSEVLLHRAAAAASDLVTSAPVALASDAAGVRVTVDLDPGAVRVLKLSVR